ncbi:MAG TPA: hypothetical protein VNF06_03765 [Candidatus Aquilonibacter sp.]|nr:hypothetical protein [Candidatus Aquilonibacter sp.]
MAHEESKHTIRWLQLQIRKLERMRDGWEPHFYKSDSEDNPVASRPPAPGRLTPRPGDPNDFDLKGSSMTAEMHWKALTEKINELKAELEEKKRQGGYVKP